MNAEEIFRGKLVMAPMTRGTDLPFRRLVSEWDGEVSYGEMAFAHKVVRRDKRELALLRRHPEEKIFGAQICGKKGPVVADAARIAEDQGADFIDLNLGCPMEAATRRGFGAALLERPRRVGELIGAMKAAVKIPVTIKLRLGWTAGKPTYQKIAKVAEEAGVDAIALHARSRSQRYRQPADWSHVGELVRMLRVPVIGNGDILNWQDAGHRLEETGCAAVMIGRWALAKPWIFREFAEQRDIPLDSSRRVEVIRRYVEICLELLGRDEKGRERTRRFLTFHQDFFRRYRREARTEGVNSDDPRNWGNDPADELEQWLYRGDLGAVEALCDWLIESGPAQPPPLDAGSPRAVSVQVYG